jgi:hypothetical protein
MHLNLEKFKTCFMRWMEYMISNWHIMNLARFEDEYSDNSFVS